MLIRYIPWVPMRGVPMCCFCHGCPMGGGAALVPMRFYATLVNIGPKQSPNLLLKSPTTNWHQPGVAS
jgi:hypothetical protein